jgi:hypothetical protein
MTPESLFASLLERKLKQKGVRISRAERERLRAVAGDVLRTGDAGALNKAIPRKREIHIDLTENDLAELERIRLDATQASVTKTTARLARSMATEISKWGEQQVAWSESLREGFEERLARTWRNPFGRYARFLEVAAYIGELTVAHFRERGVLEKSRQANALLMLHVRACAVAREVETLFRAGYADGAAARWRTLHEISVAAAFLVEHGEDAADRYLAHFPCEQLRGARSYEEHCRALGYEPLGAAFLDRLKQQVDGLTQKYGEAFRHDYGWAAHALSRPRVTFADIEQTVKLGYMRPFYRSASEQVHSSSRGAIMRGGLISQDPMQLQLVAGASNYGFADTAQNSARALLIGTVSLVQVEPTIDTLALSMILAEWLEPLMESFAKVQLGIEKRDARIRARAQTARTSATGSGN